MAKGLITHAYLEDTADAIRVLRGESDTYTPDEFNEKILDAIPDVEVTDSIVSISDAAAYPAEGLEFAIEPVQDLHGYDKPWPAGGGKNKFNANGITSFANMELVDGIFKNTVTDTKTVFVMAIQLWDDFTFVAEFPKTISDTGRKSITFSISSTITRMRIKHNGASKDIGIWFNWNEQGTYTLSLNVTGVDPTTIGGLSFTDVQIEEGSTATSYEPYSNICPISGWTGVNGERTGENLVFKTIPQANINNAGQVFSNPFSLAVGRVKAGITYTATTDDISGMVYGFFENEPEIGSISYDNQRVVDKSNKTFTAPIDGYVVFRISYNYATPQLELGSTATSYEPYQGVSIPITFPTEAGTVYGGKVDVVNGKLLAYPEYDSYNGETLTGKWISDRDVYVEGTTPTIGAQVVDLSGVGTEYDITPQQVQMLLGTNNIWCNTGSTTLTYKPILTQYVDISTAIKKFFDAQRTGKVYQVKIPKFADNDTTVCVKQLDNAGLVAEPSTDSVIGRDDYLDIPVFQWYRCNYVRDAAGVAIVTALEGDSNYSTTGTADVGSLVMSRYRKWEDFGTYSLLTISDSPHPELGLRLMKNSKDKDGNDKGYMIFSAYYGLYSQPDVAPLLFVSHNAALTAYQAKGAGYWGQDDERLQFIYDNILLKYATKSSQTVFTGCSNYNYQYDAAYKDSTAHTYFPLTAAQAATIAVGSAVCVGYASLNTSTGALNKDRGLTTVRSKVESAKVLKKEAVTLDGVDYIGVYLDVPAEQAFNTLDTDISTATYPDTYSPAMLSTMPWGSGSTDAVVGKRDGSLGSNTDSKHPFRIMGIEAQIGAWDVVCDTVMRINADYSTDFFQAPKGVAHSTDTTTIANAYTLIGTMDKDVGGSTAFWVGDVASPNGTFYPSARGNSDSKGCGDHCYRYTSTGWREVLRSGYLGSGSDGGCARLTCNVGFVFAPWYFAVAD